MKKGNWVLFAYYLAACCFFILSLTAKNMAYVPLGICFLVLGITSQTKKDGK